MTFRILALATVSLSTLVAAGARAQENSADDAIIVTAQLREQNPIDVPMTLSVLTGEELDRFGIQEFDELSRFVPGFEVQNQSPNNPGFVMRGITSDSGAATNEPRVSVFQDGVSISKSRGSYVELFDLERVEIAKGPQSTLYGRGALIGAVNLIQSKAKLNRLEAAGTASFGNFNAWLAEAMVNAPLGENVAIRLAGRARERDGYTPNLLGGETFGGKDFNSADTKALRGSLHAATGGLTFDLIGNYQKDRPAGTAFKSIAYNPTDPTTGAVIGNRDPQQRRRACRGCRLRGRAPARPRSRSLGRDRPCQARAERPPRPDVDHGLSPLLGAGDLRRGRPLAAILTAAEDARGNQTSQELRLTYEQGPLTAFVGASYFHEDGTQRVPTQFDEREALARLAGALNGGGAIPGRPATDPAPAAPVRQHGLHRPAAARRRRRLWRRAGRPARAGHCRQSQARASRNLDQRLAYQCVRPVRRRDSARLGEVRGRRRPALFA